MSTNIYFSILTPTYNAEKYLRLYFESLVCQTFPDDQFEIFIIDGGSQDDTVKIAQEYQTKLPIRILENPFKNAEHGKKIGLDASAGKVIVLLDSDNEVTSKTWLTEAYEVFEKFPDLWGLESTWFEKPGDKAISRYFASMNYCDPVARLFSPRPIAVEKTSDYELYKANTSDTPVIGANGFFWKKSVIMPYLKGKAAFEETNLVAQLIQDGEVNHGKLLSSGIYHYYVSSVEGYINKRIKIARKFMQRKAKGQRTWVDKAGFSKLIISSIYNFSFLGPLGETLFHIFKKKQFYWLYHPLICFLTVLIYADNYLKKVQNIVISIFVFVFTFILYSPLFQSHFQQDEWHNLGWHIFNIGEYGYWNAFGIAATSWIPVTQVYNFFTYTLFGTSVFDDVVVLMFILFLNTFVLTSVLSHFTKSKMILVFVALLAFINAVSVQAIHWVLPAIAIQFSLLFGLLSVLSTIHFAKTGKLKYLVLLIITFFLSVFSKFSGITFLPIIATVYFAFSPSGIVEVLRKYYLQILGVLSLFLVFIFNSFLPYFTSSRLVSRSDFVLNFWYVPISSISKILYPFPSHFYSLASYLFLNRYDIEPVPQLIIDGFAVESLTTQISLVLIIITILLFTFKKFRAIVNLPLLYFALVFYFSNILIFTLDNSTTGLGFLESRHYFPSNIGIGIILVLVVTTLFNVLISGKLILKASITILSLLSLVILHAYYVRYSVVNPSVTITSARETLLANISESIPLNKAKSLILYVDEKHPYGHTNITGQYFQTGLLYPLLVYNYDKSEISHKLFENDVLWDYNFQGIYSVDESKVGYYYNYEKLVDDYRSGLFSLDDIYAVRFNYYVLEENGLITNSMLDISKIKPEFITDEIRMQLE